ncbi:MAG: Na/Pi cotransporter family protein [Lachnospiraceae bacterium]|nr:Na/Pi cotransporter family protein [Lachnospiraceae bacterium]
MDIFSVLNMIGGLALFLYGMNNMGNGLSKMAGSKLEGVLERLTSKKIFAVLLGLGVTAVIQSSSATTVMVVGFVNSGIMALSQAVGIIMGANIGTTVTSWMLSLTSIEGDTLWLKLLKPSSFSPILAAIGIVLIMKDKEETKGKDIGNILLGFAILMFGMETMSDAVSGLAENDSFTSLMTAFSNPVLGMIVGAGLTAIIQSSSASVGILQALCATGAVNFSVAFPIIMGQNIGTCVTSLISSIGASKNAKRAAMVHLYFNLIGTIIFMAVFYSLNLFITFAFLDKAANAAGIAVIHSLFNISATLVLYPFSNGLVKLATLTIPDKEGDEDEGFKKAVMIDERFLERPAFAVEICRQKVFEMAEKTKEAIIYANATMLEYDVDTAIKVAKLEDEIDDYEDVLGSYIVKLSSKHLSAKDSRSLTQMLHSISDFERISDHALNIVHSINRINKKEYTFSKTAKKEIYVLCSAVNDIVTNTADVFIKSDLEKARVIEPLEMVIDRLTKRIKDNHVKRLQKGACNAEMGLIFEDVLLNLERVADHCSNVAMELSMLDDNKYETHVFLEDMSEDEKEYIKEEYKNLKKKYSIKKEDVKIVDEAEAKSKKEEVKSKEDSKSKKEEVKTKKEEIKAKKEEAKAKKEEAKAKKDKAKKKTNKTDNTTNTDKK